MIYDVDPKSSLIINFLQILYNTSWSGSTLDPFKQQAREQLRYDRYGNCPLRIKGAPGYTL
jgi:hypothetical protein